MIPDGLPNQFLNWRTANGRKMPCAPNGDPVNAHDPQVISIIFKYCHITGDVWWRKREPYMFSESGIGAVGNCKRWNTRFANKLALTALCEGYYRGTFLRTNITRHKVAWLIFHGKSPVGVIDHVDGNRLNNKIDNLRDVTMTENNKNKSISRNNTSNVTGVSFDKSRNKWVVGIGHDNKYIRIGRFDNYDDAVTARKKMEKSLGYHSNHGRVK